MAVRRWRVYPDHEVQVGFEVVAAVSDGAMADAYMKAQAIQSALGGIVSVIVGRTRTDLEGEAVTTGAVFEWKDGVSTRVKLEPEVNVVPKLEVDEEPYETAGEVDTSVDPAPAEDPPEVGHYGVEPDGLDPETLDVEDDSAIPASAR